MKTYCDHTTFVPISQKENGFAFTTTFMIVSTVKEANPQSGKPSHWIGAIQLAA